MTYNELLKQESWYEKCVEILHRDKYRCQKCGKLGYHNNAYYECRTADELDSFLKGILIKDDKPSVFIQRIPQNERLYDFYILHNEVAEAANIQLIGDNYLSDLTVSADKIGMISWKIPTASKHKIQDSKCQGPFLPIDKKDIKLSLETNLQYSTGRYFIFDNSNFDKYVVRIEKRWPTGACTDNNYGGGVIMWGSIFISICYQNRCISLEFYDRTSVDNEGNYLETPITPKALNVHHRYYVDGKNPWEYDDDVLITLCQDCHCLEHKSTRTPVYKELYNKHVLRYAEICNRCGGSGYLPQYHHRDNGICYRCHGEGVIVDQNDAEADIRHNTNEH